MTDQPKLTPQQRAALADYEPLIEAHEAATEGEWTWIWASIGGYSDSEGDYLFAGAEFIPDDEPGSIGGHWDIENAKPLFTPAPDGASAEDSKVVALTHNQLPSLLVSLADARIEREEARAEVETQAKRIEALEIKLENAKATVIQAANKSGPDSFECHCGHTYGVQMNIDTKEGRKQARMFLDRNNIEDIALCAALDLLDKRDEEIAAKQRYLDMETNECDMHRKRAIEAEQRAERAEADFAEMQTRDAE